MYIYQPLKGAEANNASNQEINEGVTVSFRQHFLAIMVARWKGGG
jgi:hypothetical protein